MLVPRTRSALAAVAGDDASRLATYDRWDGVIIHRIQRVLVKVNVASG